MSTNKYKLIVNGYQLECHAHKLKQNEAIKIKNLKKEKDIKELASIHDEIEDLIENYSISENNWWSLIAPFAEESTSFTLIDGLEKQIWKAKLNDLGDVYELSDKYPITKEGFDEPLKIFHACPGKDIENILFTIQENKGCLGELSFESNNMPIKKDFAVVVGCIETQENEIEYLARFYFRGQELDWEYDYEDVKGKKFSVKLYSIGNEE